MKTPLKPHYPLLLTISLVLVIPMLFWLPSYGVLMAVSIVALLLFTLGVSLLIALLTACEKAGMSIFRLFRRRLGTAQSQGSLLHNS
jgi:hypothetical protein